MHGMSTYDHGMTSKCHRYSPSGTSTVSVVVLPEDDSTKFTGGHRNAADYVILSDCAKLV